MTLKFKDLILIGTIFGNSYFNYLQREEYKNLVKELREVGHKQAEQFQKIIYNNKIATVDLKEALLINKSQVVQMNSSQVDSWFPYFQALLPYLIGTIVVCGMTYYIYYKVFSISLLFPTFKVDSISKKFTGDKKDDSPSFPPVPDNSSNSPTIIVDRNSFDSVSINGPVITDEIIASKIADSTLIEFKATSNVPFEGYKIDTTIDTNVADANLSNFLKDFLD